MGKTTIKGMINQKKDSLADINQDKLMSECKIPNLCESFDRPTTR